MKACNAEFCATGFAIKLPELIFFGSFYKRVFLLLIARAIMPFILRMKIHVTIKHPKRPSSKIGKGADRRKAEGLCERGVQPVG
jgi:hypothetical protein